jgi:chemotaxis protein methyltransferase CheR
MPPVTVATSDRPAALSVEAPAPPPAASEIAAEAARMARLCANSGQLAEALQWAEKAVAADKLDAGLHYLRATILQEQGGAAEAAEEFKRALYLDPEFVLAHFALGNLALRRRQPGEAGRYFANTLELLSRYEPGAVLPQSEGLVAGRLKQIVESTLPEAVS